MNFKIVVRKVLVSVAGLITISFPYYIGTGCSVSGGPLLITFNKIFETVK